MRLPLSEDSEIKYEEKQTTFTIDSLIGEGANGYVYKAHYLDSGGIEKFVHIKECFPKKVSASRIGDLVNWDIDNQREQALDRFKKSYDFSSKIQNDVALQISGIYDLDIFEANNTKYIATIPNHGYSYDKEESGDVVDAVRTALALTNVIAVYHDSGYLHLDIKPSNFVAVDDSTGNGKNIILFDTDSVLPIESLTTDSKPVISYTQDWAPPEQIAGTVDKIGFPTDLYAIGAVLFEKIMGHRVKAEDCRQNAEWEYDDRLQGKDINPLIRKVFTEIFHKTLAEDPDSRYSSAGELSEKLKKVLDLLTGKAPFLISNLSSVSSECIGRENEMFEVYSALKSAGKIFIEGIGGIGKSTLARAYAESYRDEYDAVVLLRYDSSKSIGELLRDIPIGGNVAENKDKNEILQEICDERSLIILDNLDITATEDNLNPFLQLNCHCIITTRTDFSDVYGQVPRLSLSSLSKSSLWTLFERESNRTLTTEDKYILTPLLHWGEECTLFWFLLARLVKTGWYTIENICKKITGAFGTFLDSAEVVFNKDENPQRMTIMDALNELFRLRNLSNQEIQMMQNIYFLQTIGISMTRLREIAQTDDDIDIAPYIKALSMLIELGYVQRFEDECGTLTMSDVMAEMFCQNFHPTLPDSVFVNVLIRAKFFLNIKDPYRLPSRDWRFDLDKNQLKLDSYKQFYGCLVKIFMRADMNLDANADYMLNLLYRPSCDIQSLWGLFSDKAGDYVSKALDRIASDQNRPQELRRKAYHILGAFYGSWFCEHLPYLDETDYLTDPCEFYFWRELELSNEQSLSPSELDDLCRTIVETTFLENLSSEVIVKTIELNPPILHQPETRDFETYAAARNLIFQKMYLQKSNTESEALPEPAQKELYYKTLGGILSKYSFKVSPIDAEHFYLLQKFYSESAERFSVLVQDDADDSDVSEWLSPQKGDIEKNLPKLKQIMAFDSWEEYQENGGSDIGKTDQGSDNNDPSLDNIKPASEWDINKLASNIQNVSESITRYNDFKEGCDLLKEYKKFYTNIDRLIISLDRPSEEIRENEKSEVMNLIPTVTSILHCFPKLENEDETVALYDSIYSFLTIAYAIFGVEKDSMCFFQRWIKLIIEFWPPEKFREAIKQNNEKAFDYLFSVVSKKALPLIKCVKDLAGPEYTLPLLRELIERHELFKGKVPDSVYRQNMYALYKNVADWADATSLNYIAREYRQKMELILPQKFDPSDSN